MTKKQKELIESLRLEVICPAKSKNARGIKRITLMQTSWRYFEFREDEKSFWQWRKDFADIGLDLECELQKLIKQEIGENFQARQHHFSAYLGFGTNTWYELEKIGKKRNS